MEALTEAEIWRAYRNAFAKFSAKTRHVRSLASQRPADRQAIDAALLEMEKARLVYRGCRDALAERLLQSSALRQERPAVPAFIPEPSQDRIRDLAALRWELAGRPQGTAEDDWLRAEEIVRSVEAA